MHNISAAGVVNRDPNLPVEGGLQFWLYTLYDKDERDDLSPQQRKTLKAMLKAELEARRKA